MARSGAAVAVAVVLLVVVWQRHTSAWASASAPEQPVPGGTAQALLTIYVNGSALARSDLAPLLPPGLGSTNRTIFVLGQDRVLTLADKPVDPAEVAAMIDAGANCDGDVCVTTTGSVPEVVIAQLAAARPRFDDAQLLWVRADRNLFAAGLGNLNVDFDSRMATFLGGSGMSMDELGEMNGLAPLVKGVRFWKTIAAGLRTVTASVRQSGGEGAVARLQIEPLPGSAVGRFIELQARHATAPSQYMPVVPNPGALVFLDLHPQVATDWSADQFEGLDASAAWTNPERSFFRDRLGRLQHARGGQFLFATFEHGAMGPHAVLFASTRRPDDLLETWLDVASLIEVRSEQTTDLPRMLAFRAAAARPNGSPAAAYADVFSGPTCRATSIAGEHPAFAITSTVPGGFNGSVAFAPLSSGLIGVAGPHGLIVLDELFTSRQGGRVEVRPGDTAIHPWLRLQIDPGAAARQAAFLGPMSRLISSLSFGDPLLTVLLALWPVAAQLDGVETGVDVESWVEEGGLVVDIALKPSRRSVPMSIRASKPW
jgi:hypothetical protein